MVTPDITKVIDPEFAFYGPMAFDMAKILANLLLALFASYGLEKQDSAGGSSRAAQRGEVSSHSLELCLCKLACHVVLC